MNDKYKLFDLTENCTDEEFEQAYQQKRKISIMTTCLPPVASDEIEIRTVSG